MNKRDFIKSGLIALAGLSSVRLRANNLYSISNKKGAIVGGLPYAKTDMGKLFSLSNISNYIREYEESNKALNKHLEPLVFKPKTTREIIENENKYNKIAVEKACEYYNHKVFLKLINPINSSVKNINNSKALLTKNFGSLEELKSQCIKEAENLDSKGWVWIIRDNNSNKLRVISTNYNQCPLLKSLSIKGFPVIGINASKDVYKNDYSSTTQYIDAFFHNINWDFVKKRIERANKYSS